VAERLAGAGLDPVLLEAAPGRANVVARIAGADPAAGELLAHGHLDVGRTHRSAADAHTMHLLDPPLIPVSPAGV
jgi:hypothetical protein